MLRRMMRWTRFWWCSFAPCVSLGRRNTPTSATARPIRPHSDKRWVVATPTYTLKSSMPVLLYFSRILFIISFSHLPFFIVIRKLFSVDRPTVKSFTSIFLIFHMFYSFLHSCTSCVLSLFIVITKLSSVGGITINSFISLFFAYFIHYFILAPGVLYGHK